MLRSRSNHHAYANPIPNITSLVSIGYVGFQCCYAGLNALQGRNLIAVETLISLVASPAQIIITAGVFIGLASSAISLLSGRTGVAEMPGLIFHRGVEAARNSIKYGVIGEGVGVVAAVLMQHDNPGTLSNTIRALKPYAETFDLYPYSAKVMEWSCEAASASVNYIAKHSKDPIVLAGIAAVGYVAYLDYNQGRHQGGNQLSRR